MDILCLVSGITLIVKISNIFNNIVYFICPWPKNLVLNKIKKLQFAQRNRTKNSRNYDKDQLKISKLHRKIANVRLDWISKTTTAIAKNHSLVVIENLQIKNMTASASGTLEDPGTKVAQKNGLNKSLARMGMYEQERQLSYKTKWYGSLLISVPAHWSSCECRMCGYRSKKNRKTQSQFHCVNCEHQEHADTHASKVILTRGQRELVCGEDVSDFDLESISKNSSQGLQRKEAKTSEKSHLRTA